MYKMSDDDHAGNEKCAHADHRIMEIKQSGQRKQCKRKNASVKIAEGICSITVAIS